MYIQLLSWLEVFKVYWMSMYVRKLRVRNIFRRQQGQPPPTTLRAHELLQPISLARTVLPTGTANTF